MLSMDVENGMSVSGGRSPGTTWDQRVRTKPVYLKMAGGLFLLLILFSFFSSDFWKAKLLERGYIH